MDWSRLQQRLLAQADRVQQNLIWLLSGFGLCVLGLVLILLAEYLFGQSLQQELLALLGIILMAGGLILAAAGYLSLSLLRVLRFLDRKDD